MVSKAYEAAKALSAFLHEGQVDKAGQPYYLHPLAVSEKVDTEKEKIVALLHDVLEDTRATEDTIRNLFGDEVAEAVVFLTRRREESYMDFIRRASQNEIAKKVKMVDLEHNMDASRLPFLGKEDLERLQKYKAAYEYLTK